MPLRPFARGGPETPAARPSQHAPELRAAARHIGRRRFLTATAAAAALARADFKTVPYVTRQGAPVTTAASFVTEVGEQGLKPA